MSLILWIVVGALAGWLASIVMDADASMGTVANILVGMAGSLIGGILVSIFARGQADLTTQFTNFNLTSIFVSFIGAIVLLGAMKFLRKAA